MLENLSKTKAENKTKKTITKNFTYYDKIIMV